MNYFNRVLFYGFFSLFLTASFSFLAPPGKLEKDNFYLNLLKVSQNKESIDYINNRKQYQLHSLKTEQFHPITRNLSQMAQTNDHMALKSLLEVDRDISHKITSIENDANFIKTIKQAISSIKKTILSGSKIYVYGTGSTGRLAKQIENFWKTFWYSLKKNNNWPSIKGYLKDIIDLDHIENHLIGEITGGDRALIKSLEGFEDLELIGQLQMQSHHIKADDMVFAVTEGGETSAVIGTIIAASKLNRSQPEHLYFLYNNPNKRLMPFFRSKKVLIDPKISKLNFTTGNQAIAGSTRMQATTSQTFLLAMLLKRALIEIFQEKIPTSKLTELQYHDLSTHIIDDLKEFTYLQKQIENHQKDILDIAHLEYNAYLNKGRAIYFADKLLTTLFIDVTERAPTFNLAALDQKNTPPSSLVDIYTNALDLNQAWIKLLNRDFKGLKKNTYKESFEKNIKDPYLRKTAIDSLDRATYDQKFLYDFSLEKLGYNSFNPSDIAIAYLMVNEQDLLRQDSAFIKWVNTLKNHKMAIVLFGLAHQREESDRMSEKLKKIKKDIQIKKIILSDLSDLLEIKQKIALKLFLNAQSTLIMAKLERLLGNGMIYVYPSNLKLTGRATYLIQLHINETLAKIPQLSHLPKISYNEANAILFDGVHYIEKNKKKDKVPIIPLTIIRVFESIKHKKPISWEESEKSLNKFVLSQYFENLKKELSTLK